ncbi:MAG: hypothetical protein IKP48_00020 [Bacteroidaceae bacterium]|jgi:uncharacterized protein YciI|nr:hypothetical protein [Bacteroidaceae bacterium]
MQFVIRAIDGVGKLAKRMEVRPRHFEGMDRLKDHLVCAGGLLDGAGNLKGSVLVMEFETRQELDDYLSHEVYVVEGVWEQITVDQMNVAYLDKKRVV